MAKAAVATEVCLNALQIFRVGVCRVGRAGLGPELYGVEPWYYYTLNASLAFNVVFVLAMIMPVVCRRRGRPPTGVKFSPSGRG